MKITLILAAAPSDPLRNNEPFMPLALPLLAGTAPDHEYTFIDMLAGETVDYQQPVDVVGISARVTAQKTAFDIADRFRSQSTPVIIGGPQASAVPFAASQHADAVAIGEGEPLWPIILADLQHNALKEFYVCSPGRFDGRGHTVHTVEVPADLSAIPSPLRSPYRRRYLFDTVFAARGCPMGCEFCSVPGLFGKATRLRPVEDVVAEIDSFRNFYYLLDDTVFGRPFSQEYYLELYHRIAALNKRRLWTGQANLDAASTPRGREVIAAAARAGLTVASIGIESLNPTVLSKSNMHQKSGLVDNSDTRAELKERIRYIQQQGIFISGWFVIGYEEDTLDTVHQALDFCREMDIAPVICPLEAIEGTGLYERLSGEGRIASQKKLNIVHPQLNEEELLDELHKATKTGFSLGQITRRTAHGARFFANSGATRRLRTRDWISKSIFVFVTQVKMKKGLFGLVNQFH